MEGRSQNLEWSKSLKPKKAQKKNRGGNVVPHELKEVEKTRDRGHNVLLMWRTKLRVGKTRGERGQLLTGVTSRSKKRRDEKIPGSAGEQTHFSQCALKLVGGKIQDRPRQICLERKSMGQIG